MMEELAQKLYKFEPKKKKKSKPMPNDGSVICNNQECECSHCFVQEDVLCCKQDDDYKKVIMELGYNLPVTCITEMNECSDEVYNGIQHFFLA